mgnify:FL=1
MVTKVKRSDSTNSTNNGTRKVKRNPVKRSEVHTGENFVRIQGLVASALTSREGILARRIEVVTTGAREILDLECEKKELSGVFRSLKVGQRLLVEGSIRRRFWRNGAQLVSRTYIEVNRLQAQPPSPTKKR